MIAGTCKYCKWFEVVKAYKAKAKFKYGKCNNAVDLAQMTIMSELWCDDEIKIDGLHSKDYEGYESIVIVGQDFGCIHFEEAK